MGRFIDVGRALAGSDPPPRTLIISAPRKMHTVALSTRTRHGLAHVSGLHRVERAAYLHVVVGTYFRFLHPEGHIERSRGCRQPPGHLGSVDGLQAPAPSNPGFRVLRWTNRDARRNLSPPQEAAEAPIRRLALIPKLHVWAAAICRVEFRRQVLALLGVQLPGRAIVIDPNVFKSRFLPPPWPIHCYEPGKSAADECDQQPSHASDQVEREAQHDSISITPSRSRLAQRHWHPVALGRLSAKAGRAPGR